MKTNTKNKNTVKETKSFSEILAEQLGQEIVPDTEKWDTVVYQDSSKLQEIIRQGDNVATELIDAAGKPVETKEELSSKDAPLEKKNYAYITYLSTDSYIYCLLALIESFKATNSKYPLYCGVTKDVSTKVRNIIKKLGVKCLELNTTPFENLRAQLETTQIRSNFLDSTYKLAIFELFQFDKCIYLDADLLINKNIDELFEAPHLAAVWPEVQFYDNILTSIQQLGYTIGSDLFNAGLFVFEPTKQFYDKILNFINNYDFTTLEHGVEVWNDQKILSYFNQDWLVDETLRLPVHYNIVITTPFITDYLKKYKKSDIIIEHYVDYKYYPLLKKHIVTDGKYTFHKKYMEYINNVIDKYKLKLTKNKIELLSCPLIEDGWY